MKTRRRFVLVAVCAIATTNAAAADEPKTAANFLQEWARTWETSNVDEMMAFYDSTEETMAIESLGHVRKGPAQIHQMYTGAFDELIFDRVTLTPVTTGDQGSVAWATCRYKAEMRLKSGNTRFVLEVRGSFVMKKVKNTWKIALEHFSTIPGIPRVRPAD